jgi:hypothetical protein
MNPISFRSLASMALVILVIVVIGSVRVMQAEDQAVRPYTIAGTRNMRFGEILIAKPTGIEVYNTTCLNDCPPALWNALNLDEIKKQFGALKVELNGPHY